MKDACQDRDRATTSRIDALIRAGRTYAESPEGQGAVDDLLDEKAEKVDFLRELLKGAGSSVNIRPVFDISDELKEEIYPGEPDRVEAGLEMGRTRGRS